MDNHNLQELIDVLTSDEENPVLTKDLMALRDTGLLPHDLPVSLKPTNAQEAFQLAFEAMGGLPRLLLYADRNPGAFYKLYARLLTSSAPQEPPDPPPDTPTWVVDQTPSSPQSQLAGPDPMDSLDDDHATH